MLPAGLLQDPGADGHDLARLLRDRDERGGRDHAARGMLPAHQRLDTDHMAAGAIEQGLVEQLQFVAVDDLAQVVFDRQPLLRLGMELRREEHRHVAPA